MEHQQTLTIGILGLGPAGLAMLPFIQAHPRIRLGAVCDQRPEALQAFEATPDVARFSNIAELCQCADINAVFVATPTWLHAEHAIAALNAGKHVIVEKPMTVTLEEADLMIRTARENRRALIVGHSHSFEPAIQLMRAAIESQRFGALKAINAWNYTDWVYRPRLPVEFDRSRGGGVVYRQAAHHADIVRYLAGGSPRSVRASVSSWDQSRVTDGSYSAFLGFDNDTVASLFYSGYDHFPGTELTFDIGENGRKAPAGYARARRQSKTPSASASKHTSGLALQMERLAPGSHPAFFGIVIVSCERADLRIGADGICIYADESRHVLPIDTLPVGRTAVLNELLDAAEGQATTHDGEWGRANLEACCAIIESSSRGSEIRLDVAKAAPVSVPAAIKNHFEKYWQCL